MLTQGDILFIPSLWMHYITSLTPTVQCNARFNYPNRQTSPYESIIGGRSDVVMCMSRAGERKHKRKSLRTKLAPEFHIATNI